MNSNNLVLKYIIYEQSTDTLEYTFENIDTKELFDISHTELLESLDNDEANITTLIYNNNPKKISVWNKSNTGGKLIEGLNDLYTYCMKNNKKQWLDCYIAGNNEQAPTEIAWSSGKMVKIHCTNCGIIREISLNTYTGQPVSCICKSLKIPYCKEGINDLYTFCKNNNFDYLLEEYNDEKDIHKVSYGTNTKIHWKCKYGHEWDAAPSARIGKDEGCPYCKGSQTSRAERTVANWLKENNINIIEREKIQGEEFDIHIVDYNILIEFNSDATHNSEKQRQKDVLKHEIAKSINHKLIVVMQNCYSIFDNTLYYDILFKYNSDKNLDNMIKELSELLCKYGLNINNQVSNNAKASANKNDVPFERSIAGRYDGIEEIWGESNIVTPDRLYASTRQYIYLKCKKCNQEYNLRGDALKQSWDKENKGCPYCSGKKVLPGITDLETLMPELTKEWAPNNLLKPSEVSIHSNKYVNWICSKCGHTWNAMINNRTGVCKEGCPACAGKTICNSVNTDDLIDDFNF